MYESYYGFSKRPFSLASDSDFLYMGKTHSAAFAMLEYGVLSQAGFTVITGEVGSGKTTLIHHLLSKINDQVTVGLINNTSRNMGELLPWILYSFKLEYREENKVALYENFSRFLTEQHDRQQRTVLLVDEAQNLDTDVLDELRMLSNLNATSEQFLQIILVGQPELRQLLNKRELMQFSQRVAADYHIAPLSIEETIAYIKYRLVKAGAVQDVFTPHAYIVVHVASRGVPRLINILCDTALSFAFGDDIQLIDENYIKDVLRERAEGGLLALGQDPLKLLGDEAYANPNLDELFDEVSEALKRRSNH